MIYSFFKKGCFLHIFVDVLKQFFTRVFIWEKKILLYFYVIKVHIFWEGHNKVHNKVHDKVYDKVQNKFHDLINKESPLKW